MGRTLPSYLRARRQSLPDYRHWSPTLVSRAQGIRTAIQSCALTVGTVTVRSYGTRICRASAKLESCTRTWSTATRSTSCLMERHARTTLQCGTATIRTRTGMVAAAAPGRATRAPTARWGIISAATRALVAGLVTTIHAKATQRKGFPPHCLLGSTSTLSSTQILQSGRTRRGRSCTSGARKAGLLTCSRLRRSRAIQWSLRRQKEGG